MLRDDGQRVAGADVGEVLGVGAAVEQALEPVLMPRRAARGALKVSFDWPGMNTGVPR